MITSVTLYNQRDRRWGNLQLGTVDGTTIGGYGCLISSIAMAQSLFGPDQPYDPGTVNRLFTENKGYANGNLVIWTAIPRILPNITYLGARYSEYSAAPTEELKGHLDRGGLALIEVAFRGVAFDSKGNRINRHWLLANGHDDQGIIKADPWYGDVTNFTAKDEHGAFRYGTGNSTLDILTIHYLGDATPQAPVADPPQTPVAKLPTENPIPAPEPVGSDLTPGKGGIEIEWEPLEAPVQRTVAREGAHGVDVTTGQTVVQNVPVGTVVDVAGYFTAGGVSFARTVYSLSVERWVGLPIAYFEEPTGQTNGEVPVSTPSTPTIAPDVLRIEPDPEAPPANAVYPTPEPPKQLSLFEAIMEWVARVAAAYVARRKVK